MITYYWFSDLANNWLPTSGFYYSNEEDFRQSYYNYFVDSGYTRIRMSELNNWEKVDSYDDGIKYFIPIITDSVSIGIAFKYELYKPFSGPTISGYVAQPSNTFGELERGIDSNAATLTTG